MEKIKERQRVVTTYQSLVNREGIVEEIFKEKTAMIRSDDGQVSHHLLSRLKPIGGNDNDK